MLVLSHACLSRDAQALHSLRSQGAGVITQQHQASWWYYEGQQTLSLSKVPCKSQAGCTCCLQARRAQEVHSWLYPLPL